jgi:hypothetical protein
VNFLQKIAQRLLLVFQFVLVFIFILFEEIIWEGIAKPIYEKIQSLKILQKLKAKIAHSNRYIILVVFLVLLLTVELAGLLAGVFFVQGYILFGLTLYMVKIPIAAFVFWLFKVSKSKLLSFDWFDWSYAKVMSGLDWLKDLDIYKTTMMYISKLKRKIKEQRVKYFSKESRFTEELKSFYSYIKNFKNKKEKEEEKQND